MAGVLRRLTVLFAVSVSAMAGWIYFAGGSHLYSYKVPAGARPGSE